MSNNCISSHINTLLIYIFIMHQKEDVCSKVSQIQDKFTDRYSNNTLDSEGQNINQCQEALVFPMLTNCYERNQYFFNREKKQKQLEQKLSQKAISWIQTTCYIKGLDFETTLLSISVFYVFIKHSSVDKKNLQSIICTSLFIATKMTSKVQFSMADILALVDHRISSKDILSQEQALLQLLDFNLHLQFPILQLIDKHLIQEQHKQKVKFLTQLLLIKQPSLLFNVKKCEQIYRQATKQKLQYSGEGVKIRKIAKRKNSQHLTSKYQSKFDIQTFALGDQNIDIVYNN